MLKPLLLLTTCESAELPLLRAEGPVVIFILFFILIIVLAVVGAAQEKKRREALQALASRLGFSFHPDKNHSFHERYNFLQRMQAGHSRYAYNIMQGHSSEGSQAAIFDYHYATTSRDSKGRTTTHHHYSWILTLALPRSFAELIIEPEGFFDKIGQALGFDDIDFESHEFSKRYKVKSPDKKFAYDICNAQMIEYLLGEPNLAIEIESDTLAIICNGTMKPELVEAYYRRLQKIRSLMPNYLFN